MIYVAAANLRDRSDVYGPAGGHGQVLGQLATATGARHPLMASDITRLCDTSGVLVSVGEGNEPRGLVDSTAVRHVARWWMTALVPTDGGRR